MIHQIPAADLFEKRLDLVFKYLDESFTFGSDSEGIEELVEEKFVQFWDFHIKYADLPDDDEIKEFASNLEDELYAMEAMEELRIDD
jgi:hypothetical protein